MIPVLGKVSARGQTTIPRRIRQALRLTNGGTLYWRFEVGAVTVTADHVRASFGILKDSGFSFEDCMRERNEERRKEREHEKRKLGAYLDEHQVT